LGAKLKGDDGRPLHVAEVPDFHSNVPALKQDRVNAEDVDTRGKAQLR